MAGVIEYLTALNTRGNVHVHEGDSRCVNIIDLNFVSLF
jgi:hypothetical protein